MNDNFNEIFKFNNPTSQTKNFSFSLNQNPQQERTQQSTISLKSVILQMSKILASQWSVSEEDLQIMTQFTSLYDLLSFFRHFPKKQCTQGRLTYQKLIQNFYKKHCLDVKQLKKVIESKNQVIIKLNDGYQQVKRYYQQMLKSNQQQLAVLRKQNCYLNAQNQLLKHKINILQNYRERRVFDLKVLNEDKISNLKQENMINIQFQQKNICTPPPILNKSFINYSPQNHKSLSQQLRELMETAPIRNRTQNINQSEIDNCQTQLDLCTVFSYNYTKKQNNPSETANEKFFTIFNQSQPVDTKRIQMFQAYTCGKQQLNQTSQLKFNYTINQFQ